MSHEKILRTAVTSHFTWVWIMTMKGVAIELDVDWRELIESNREMIAKDIADKVIELGL